MKEILLDNGVDQSARLYAQVASEYDEYLDWYFRNAVVEERKMINDLLERANAEGKRFKTEQDHNNDVLVDTVFTVERQQGINVDNMSLMVIGGGPKTLDTDFGDTSKRSILKRVRHINFGDFSPNAARAGTNAIKSLVGESRSTIAAFLYDVTNGYSTAHSRILQTGFAGCNSFAEALKASESFGKLTYEDVVDKLMSVLTDVQIELKDQKQKIQLATTDLVGGGINDGSLLLKADEEPIETNLVYLPKLIAGTGAAAEQKYMWSRIDDLVENDQPTHDEVEELYENMHEYIANYNTIVAIQTITKILNDNPKASVLAITDVNTFYDNGIKCDRLYLKKLKSQLKESNIVMQELPTVREWHDQPGHFHRVVELLCRKKTTNGTGTSDSGVLVTDE